MRILRDYGRHVAAILGLALIAGVVGGYILLQQRVRLPWDEVYTVRAELPAANSVTPGQGQQVTVAGVKVGEIGSVRLRDGRALVELTIERDRLASVGRSATALLRPKTPLQDMSVDLDPGPPSEPPLGDRVIGVARAADDARLDELLAAMDDDTRAYVRTTMAVLGQGLGGQGEHLRRALQATTPAARQLAQLDATLAGRRGDLRRLVGSFRVLTESLAAQRRTLERLVRTGDATFTAVAAEQDAVERSLDALPAALADTEATFRRLEPFSRQLARTATDLVPTAEDLGPTLRALQPFAEDAVPSVRALRTATRATQGPARQLAPAVAQLRRTTPSLTSILRVTRYTLDELAHVPASPERGYLFWLAWFGHNVNSMLGAQDANGGFWRAISTQSCTNVEPLPDSLSIVAPLYALAGDACAKTP